MPYEKLVKALLPDLTASTFLRLVQELDDNCLGELLRAITFPGEGLGCCTGNYTARTNAEAPDPGDICLLASMEAGEEREIGQSTENDPDGCCSFEHLSHTIVAGWFWDDQGDTTLLFLLKKDGRVIRSLMNGDCERTGGWC